MKLNRQHTSNPAKFDRCVKDVKAKGGAANAYAVCTAAGTRNPGYTAAERKLFAMGKRIKAGKSSVPLTWQVAMSYPDGGQGYAYFATEAKAKAFKEKEMKRGASSGSISKRVNPPLSDPALKGQVAGKRNPSEFSAAAAASEEFHGTPAHELMEVTTEIFEHDNLADLGELVSLTIAAINGGVVVLKNFEGARLAQSPKGFPCQLFIEGGDQSVDLAEFGIEDPHESEVLGKLKRLKYYTIKEHLGRDGGEANYDHKVGELSGKLPHVLYDVMNKLLSISGGDYKILPEGIDN